ncbi:hypothetical protein F2P81_007102 [Scophthalmus maximus]|uniref:Uncharacterized protein n=1 Tax=Scophthalmus maximus TaxID=52904 RepID=A0A6A4TDF0_SCOMX|nr:hypothetical protein F2P81_007102 [Scophthalmus maximus]
MGNRFSRKRDTPAGGEECAATEQKTAEEPAAEASETTGTQGAAEMEGLDVVVGEQVTLVACLECKEMEAPAASATLNDAEPEPVSKETPAPAQPNLLVSISESSPSEAEPAAGPEPVAEAQLAPEPAPEPAPQEGPPSSPEAEVEAVPEPISEPSPVPAEAPEPLTDMLSQESLPDPVLYSTPLIDLAVPDVTPQPVAAPPAPAPVSDPVDADEPSDIPVGDECQDSVEAAASCTFALEKSEEMSESLDKPAVEAKENLEQLVSDAAEESISGLLQNLELGGKDLIPSDVKIPDDTPITDISTSTDLI